jgi:hypothetical protein
MRGTIAAAALALTISPVAVNATAIDDRVLYQHIVDRVGGGEGYYQAAASELREHNYPLRPVLAFRPPTLAWIEALLPSTAARLAVLCLLTLGSVLLWHCSLSNRPAVERLALVIAAVTGLANVGALGSMYLHEAWSIVFQLAALAMLRKSAIACGAFVLCALVVRETALPFAGAMGLVAWVFGYRWAATAVAAAVALALVLYGFHALAVASVVQPSDHVSPGWLSFSGPSLVAAAAQWNLLLAPLPVGAVLVALPILLVSFLFAREQLLGRDVVPVRLDGIGKSGSPKAR